MNIKNHIKNQQLGIKTSKYLQSVLIKTMTVFIGVFILGIVI